MIESYHWRAIANLRERITVEWIVIFLGCMIGGGILWSLRHIGRELLNALMRGNSHVQW